MRAVAAAALFVLPLMGSCASCSVPFEIITFDAGTDAGGDEDAGFSDAGATDGGLPDAGEPDAGAADGGTAHSDGGTSVDAGDACGGLDIDACTLRPDCFPEVCTGCDCVDRYLGCFSDPQVCANNCPTQICCGSGDDCPLLLTCKPPTGAQCTRPCSILSVCTDFLCPDGEGCGDDPCCPGLITCQPLCANDDDCPSGHSCDTAGSKTCIPTPCQNAGDCPALYFCTFGSCKRLPCSHDIDCPSTDGGFGYCVNGQCYESGGVCVQ